MEDTASDSGNTDDLISGVYPLDSISPLESPRIDQVSSSGSTQITDRLQADILATYGQSRPQNYQVGREIQSPEGSSSSSTCFSRSNPSTVKSKVRKSSRSPSPQSRIRVHYTDNAREALELANKSYERLIHDSPEKSHLSILINKRDAEREDMERENRKLGTPPRDRSKEMVEPRNKLMSSSAGKASKPFDIRTLASKHLIHSAAETENLLQEHIKFAESLLSGSPTPSSSSETDRRRSRSLSPTSKGVKPHSASPTTHFIFIGNRSRSSSPQLRSPPRSLPHHTSDVNSSRKKLSFDTPTTRAGRERKVHDIRTKDKEDCHKTTFLSLQIMNEYLDATSAEMKRSSEPAEECNHVHDGPYHKHHDGPFHEVIFADDKPGGGNKSIALPYPEVKDDRNDHSYQGYDIPVTPDNKGISSSSRNGPMSSTPHRPQREPLRELSPSKLFSSSNKKPEVTISISSNAPSRTTPSTPGTYIRGIQSVRNGLKQLMDSETTPENTDSRTYALSSAARPNSRSEEVNARIESTINAENQLLREHLAREKNMRKQIEADKHELQSQLLESKDRIQHLSNLIKQKDQMMKKLDENLENVVTGWQTHEQENKEQTEALMQKIKRLEKDLNEQQKHAAGLEADLMSAVDELKREQDSSKTYAREMTDQQSRYNDELAELKSSLALEEERFKRLEMDKDQAEEGRRHLEEQIEALHQTLNQERESFKEREDELLNKINEITNTQIAVLEKEAERTKEQAIKIEELSSQLKRYETEAESQRHVLSTKAKEVERLESKLELLEAQHDNNIKQLESKLRMELEVRLAQARDDGLKRLAENELSIQQTHQRQLNDITLEHNRQMNEMKERFKSEMNRVRSHYEIQTQDLESNIQDLKQELKSAQKQKEDLECQRDDLTARFQAVLTLLGTPAMANQPMLGSSRSSSSMYRPAVTMSSYLPPISVSARFASAESLHSPANSLNTQKTGSVELLQSSTSSLNTASVPPAHKSSNTPSQAPSSNTESTQQTPVPSVIHSEAPAATASSGKSTSLPSSHSFLLYDSENDQHGLRTDEKPSPEIGRPLGPTPNQSRDEPDNEEVENEQPQANAELEPDNSEEVDGDSSTATYDVNEDDSMHRHKRQMELQNYIKKLLNRSVGEPLIETRVDLDESHISIISGLGDGRLSPKKAFRLEVIGQTPPVKGSTKKSVSPHDINSLMERYGTEKTTPPTSDYIKYLKSVNQKAAEQLDANAKLSAVKKNLTQVYNPPAATAADAKINTQSTTSSRISSDKSSTTAAASATVSDSRRVKRHHTKSNSTPAWR